MAEVIWSPSALDDIDAIAEFIARDSIYHASLFIDRLLEASDHLKLHPQAGRVIPEIGNQFCREVIYGSYRICTASNEIRYGLLVWFMLLVIGNLQSNNACNLTLSIYQSKHSLIKFLHHLIHQYI
jgi:plasmid stabilization system protein ParE